MKKAKKSNSKGSNRLSKIAKNFAVQRFLMVIITIIVAFVIIETGAQPTRYKLNIGDVSTYDITSPRDVVNEVLTEENRNSARENVESIKKEDTRTFIDVILKKDDFFKAVSTARTSVEKRMKELGLSQNSRSYNQYLKESQESAAQILNDKLNRLPISLSQIQIDYLISKVTDSELEAFEVLTKGLITQAMSEIITESNLDIHIQNLLNSYKNSQVISNELKGIGEQLAKSLLRSNQIVDAEATEKKKQEAYNDDANIVKIKKGSRIISFGDIVTTDKLKLLEQLNLLETKERYDYLFSLGILVILLFLVGIVFVFLRKYSKKIYNSRKELFLLCLIVVITLLLARYLFSFYNGLLIPIFVGVMLISILLNFELAVVINCVLTVCISIMLRGDYKFLYMGLVCGAISAFMVTKAHQRSKLSMNGVLLGLTNAVFIVFINFIEKSDARTILTESVAVFLNGLVSMILTIGILPFLESAFGIVTPLKLLEISNPNHPLLKKLLMEAPGTYHHSLMVGNLAEVATEDLGGNALLARAGAFFHDVGKLKRPDLFTENILSENPHERMTPYVSTVVITAHTTDGVEIATKYKLPGVIKDIIKQHHGTTLVAYFYYKAIKSESGDSVKQEDYRYEGPKPQTKEAAIVMLSDSVEAAVRSMSDKTEENIEALVRKIIKDKLDDGQLNKCQLTLADLDTIASSFMKVLSGYYHAREKYPDIKDLVKKDVFIEEKREYNIEQINNETSVEAEKDGGAKVDNN